MFMVRLALMFTPAWPVISERSVSETVVIAQREMGNIRITRIVDSLFIMFLLSLE
jgi:hypothetical protein